ncbi:hypothetical protein L3Q82_015401, partial [Scortum barcoo]
RMSVVKRAMLPMLLLAAIGANAAPGPEDCDGLNKTLPATDLHKISGNWVLVWSVAVTELGSAMLANLSSSYVELQLLPDSKTIVYNESNKFNDKSCIKYLINMTMPTDFSHFNQLHIDSGTLLKDGVVQEYNHTADVDLFETCPDCMVMVYRAEVGGFLLIYRRDGHHQDVELLKAAHSNHKKVAECLGFPHDKPFVYDGAAVISVANMESGLKMSLWPSGPQPGQFYSFPGSSSSGPDTSCGPVRHTLNPMVTGTSVLGVKFTGGVIIAADMLGSYGSLARFRNISRLMKVNSSTILGASGDYADYQYLKQVIEQMVIDEELLGDGHSYSPKAVHSWLTRVMYNRRSKMNPLWNTVVIGGFYNGESFLGYVDKLGVAYEAPTVATGFGAYLAQPLMREVVENKVEITKQEARELVERCLKVLYYRDARSYNRHEIAIVTEEGVEIIGPLSSETNWDIAHMVR